VKLADTPSERGGNDARDTAASSSSSYKLFAAESIQKT